MRRSKGKQVVESSSDDDFEQVHERNSQLVEYVGVNEDDEEPVSKKSIAKKPSKDKKIISKCIYAGVIALVALNEEHKRALYRSPLGNVLKVFLEEIIVASTWIKSLPAVQIICSTHQFIPETNDHVFVFKVGEETYVLRSSPEELSLIFGIPCIPGGGIEESFLDSKNQTDYTCGTFWKTYKFNPPKKKPCDINNTELKDKIIELIKDKGPNDDLVTMFELFLLSTIFVTTGDGGSIHSKYLACLESVGRVSLPHLIHKHLMERLKRGSSEGCHLYLLTTIQGLQGGTLRTFAIT
ncbi:hypothetical protein MKX03_027408 [Papaver bracteatum]|nr:hypothetical protein MKX03_027408 [Papaver bracteatum]